uniref:Sugar phosphate transporter domain-containing protein n=1 Tax=Ditylenchus dipsaci TaxID=166011 RepID=A0A915D7B7_9BILA
MKNKMGLHIPKYSPSKSLFLYGGLSLANGLLNRVVMNKKGKDMFLPSLFYSLSTYFALISLDGITMPFFPFIIRFYPLLIVLLNFFIFRRQRPSLTVLLVVSLVCVGSAYAAMFEFNLDHWVIICAFSALAMMAFALVLIEGLQEQYSTLEIIYMNSFNCVCIFLTADLFQDEIRDSFMYLVSSTTGLLILCLIMQCIIGVLCHAALLNCVMKISALNTAIVNSCSSALQIVVAFSSSIYLFYDMMPDLYNIFGIVLTIAATVFYFLSGKDINARASASNKFHLLQKS